MKVSEKLKKKIFLITGCLILIILVAGFFIYINNSGVRQNKVLKSFAYPTYATVKYNKSWNFIVDCFDSCSSTSVDLEFNKPQSEVMNDVAKVFEASGYKQIKNNFNCGPGETDKGPDTECIYRFEAVTKIPDCTHLGVSYRTSTSGNMLIYCN